jgi:hypothetical protein
MLKKFFGLFLCITLTGTQGAGAARRAVGVAGRAARAAGQSVRIGARTGQIPAASKQGAEALKLPRDNRFPSSFNQTGKFNLFQNLDHSPAFEGPALTIDESVRRYLDQDTNFTTEDNWQALREALQALAEPEPRLPNHDKDKEDFEEDLPDELDRDNQNLEDVYGMNALFGLEDDSPVEPYTPETKKPEVITEPTAIMPYQDPFSEVVEYTQEPTDIIIPEVPEVAVLKFEDTPNELALIADNTQKKLLPLERYKAQPEELRDMVAIKFQSDRNPNEQTILHVDKKMLEQLGTALAGGVAGVAALNPRTRQAARTLIKQLSKTLQRPTQLTKIRSSRTPLALPAPQPLQSQNNHELKKLKSLNLSNRNQLNVGRQRLGRNNLKQFPTEVDFEYQTERNIQNSTPADLATDHVIPTLEEIETTTFAPPRMVDTVDPKLFTTKKEQTINTTRPIQTTNKPSETKETTPLTDTLSDAPRSISTQAESADSKIDQSEDALHQKLNRNNSDAIDDTDNYHYENPEKDYPYYQNYQTQEPSTEKKNETSQPTEKAQNQRNNYTPLAPRQQPERNYNSDRRSNFFTPTKSSTVVTETPIKQNQTVSKNNETKDNNKNKTIVSSVTAKKDEPLVLHRVLKPLKAQYKKEEAPVRIQKTKPTSKGRVTEEIEKTSLWDMLEDILQEMKNKISRFVFWQ